MAFFVFSLVYTACCPRTRAHAQQAPSSSTSKNGIPKLAPIAQAAKVFRTEAYGWAATSGGFVRQVKIMDQWGAAFQPSIAGASPRAWPARR